MSGQREQKSFEYVRCLWRDEVAGRLTGLDRLVYRSNKPGEDLTLTDTGGGDTSSVAAQLGETGQDVSVEDPAGLTKVILDSLAFRYASAPRAAESLTGVRFAGVQIVAGGSRDDCHNRATADATGLPLLAGPVGATAAGNVFVQAVAAGRFASLAEARRHVASNVRPKTFEPRGASEGAAREYARVGSRNLSGRGETR